MFNREFIRGGLILVFCFGVANLINFAFHLSMARFLSVADYGLLATLLAIIYLLSILSESVQTIVSKNASNKEVDVLGVMNRSMRKMMRPALLLFATYLIVSIPLSVFLDIPYFLLSLNGLMIFGSLYMPINRGLLQGKKRFLPLGGNMVIESVGKLALSLVLVIIGFAVYGAIIGGLLGAGLAYAVSFINLKPLFNRSKKLVKKEIEYNYDKKSFLTIFSIMTFFAIDIVVARIVFEPSVVGTYAIASTIAKTIFFATMPVGKAMFSFTAEKSSAEKSEKVFLNALTFIGFGIIVALTMFYFFPGLWVFIFSGKHLPLAAGSLFILGIAYSLISLTNLVLLYKISIGNVRHIWLIVLMPVIEVVLLFIFSKNIMQFSFALVTSSALFLWVSLSSDYSYSRRHK
ncbi:MAG: oligosaccharide flippase family protein [Nanoarchaeota archaeon]